MLENKELSLWKLTNEHQKLFSQLYNHETGEVDELVNAKLNALCKTEEEKCIAVTQWVKKLEADRKQLEEFMNDLKSRIESYDVRIEKHRRDLQTNMESRGITNISCPLFTVRLKKNPYSTEITDKGQLPKEFIKIREVVKVEEVISKSLIKEEVLRTGNQVPGAIVSQKNKLEISINKI